MNISYKEKIRILYNNDVLQKTMAFFTACDEVYDKRDSELFSALYLQDDNKMLEEIAETFYLSDRGLRKHIKHFQKAIKYFARIK